MESAQLILRTGIRNFIVGIIVKVSSDEASMRKEKSYVNKMNLALVQVRYFDNLAAQMLTNSRS